MRNYGKPRKILAWCTRLLIQDGTMQGYKFRGESLPGKVFGRGPLGSARV